MAADPPNCAALAASRLPELPHAGYSTARQKALSDAMMFLIRGFERDRPVLLKVVLAGAIRWRRTFTREFRWLRADSELADAVFGYLVRLAGPNPEAQLARVQLSQQQARHRRWDFRFKTARRQRADAQALLDAIAKDEARTATRPVIMHLAPPHRD